MSVPTSVDELVQLIRKSGMVDEAALTAYLHRRQGVQALPADPRLAADAMVGDGLLTDFQAMKMVTPMAVQATRQSAVSRCVLPLLSEQKRP